MEEEQSQPRELPPLPSLDIIRAELDIERELREKSSSSIDTKADLVLGSSGVVVGLGFDARPGIFVLLAQCAAAVAGGLSVLAFRPRVAGAISPRALPREPDNNRPRHSQT
ncbi:MAG: hypothetical protein ACRC35_08080 [Angustibacter sp.]